ncbi:hypothetical protein HI113_45780, partial [Corallococcus exiguus]|uniref:hypothetical protein n=1 Tax=Corallococcus exiguus TaxID=83462 RepID=UPI001472AFC2
FLPNVPGLRLLEQTWREFMHHRASIPRAVNDILDEINSREFSFARLPTAVLGKIIPFGATKGSLDDFKDAVAKQSISVNARNWILASGIMSAVPIATSEAQASRRIGTRFISHHSEHFDSLRFEYKELKERI